MINAALVWVLAYLWYRINQSLRITTPSMDKQARVPMYKVASLESVRLVKGTGISLEDEVDIERRTPLDKIDRYFYETISIMLRNNDRPYVPFK